MSDAPPAARLHMRGTRTVAVFAGKLSRLGFPHAPHQGFGEFCGMACMAGHANLLADEGCFDRDGDALSFGRGRCGRRTGLRGGRRRRVAAKKILQRIDRVVRLGKLQARFTHDRPPGTHLLSEFCKLGIDRIPGLP